jgi:hypothetical protein
MRAWTKFPLLRIAKATQKGDYLRMLERGDSAMRAILSTLVLVIALASPGYAAVSKNTAAFLRTIGIDPASADVVSVAADDVHGITLNSLGAKHDKNGIKKFIATRAFFHKFMINTNMSFPPPDLYDVSYLTKPEQVLIENQIKKEFGAGPGQ